LDGPSQIAHWNYGIGDDEDESEEELEFTDAEEEDLNQRALPSTSPFVSVSSSLDINTSSRELNKTAFSILMEDREEKMKAIKTVQFKWQRGPQPSKKTIYRRRMDKKGLTDVAQEEQQTTMDTFLIEPKEGSLEVPEEDPDAGKNIFIPANEIKAALTEINKKISCKRKGM